MASRRLARTLLIVRAGGFYTRIMSILNLENTLKGLAIGSVFALGLIFASSTTASAQYGGYPGNGGYYPGSGNGGYYGRDNDRRRKEERKAYDKGYKEGYKDGKRAAERGGRWGNNNGRYGN